MSGAIDDLRTLAREHESDRDAGERLLREIAGWLRWPDAHQVRGALLELASSDGDPLWGLAVEALVRNGLGAAELSTQFRRQAGSLVWRDEVAYALARLEHEPSLDVILEHVRRHLDDVNLRAPMTLAHIGRFAPDPFAELAVPYLTRRLSIGDRPDKGLATAYLAVLADRPQLLVNVANAVSTLSAEAGRRLIESIAERLEMHPPVGGSTAISREVREAFAPLIAGNGLRQP